MFNKNLTQDCVTIIVPCYNGKKFIEQCDDIALLSDILGHESIETTRIYLHKSSTEQQDLFNQIVNW